MEYGNNYGKNYMVFKYHASPVFIKIKQQIYAQNCNFTRLILLLRNFPFTPEVLEYDFI
jgi:hypothetical protein